MINSLSLFLALPFAIHYNVIIIGSNIDLQQHNYLVQYHYSLSLFHVYNLQHLRCDNCLTSLARSPYSLRSLPGRRLSTTWNVCHGGEGRGGENRQQPVAMVWLVMVDGPVNAELMLVDG